MAQYTMRVCDMLNIFDSFGKPPYPEGYPGDYSSVEVNVENGIRFVFDMDYPIFDEAYRRVLERKILLQYYTREIGQETIALFKLHLANRLNLIMPYYNQLYLSELVKYDPLHNFDYWETHDGHGTENFDGSTSGTEDTTGHGEGAHTEGTAYAKTDSYSKNGGRMEDTETSSHTAGNKNTDTTGKTTVQGTDSGNSHTSSNDTKNTDITDKTTGNTTDNMYHNDTPQGGIQNYTDKSYMTYYENRSQSATSNTTRGEDTTGSSQTDTNTSGEHGETTDTTGNSKSTETGDTTGTSHTTGEWTESGQGKEDSTTNITGNETSDTTGHKDTHSTNTHDIRTTDDYIRHYAGKQGGVDYADMIQKWRGTFLNIDRMVIEDLECLFFGLWQ